MGRLILVSNRLPVTVRRQGTQKTLIHSAGGLVSGLEPMHQHGDGLWIGNMEAPEAARFADELRRKRLCPVLLGKEDAQRHYEGYSNRVLWPLCHYLTEHVEFDGPDYEAYARVNERFAEVVLEHARPDDLIWIHDYHLMLLPSLIRARLPQACIGFFLHIPFPSSEVFRILPRKEEILRGLLGANLIGLHTYDYARHLISAFRRVLAVEFDEDWVRRSDSLCRVGVFPLGVDTKGQQEIASQPAVQARVERLRKQVQGRKVILGVDRMDYTKGLVERLNGFEKLLARRPEWREDAVFFQLAVPSRATMESYRHLKETVDQRVGEINGLYQTGGLTPINYMYRSVPPEELSALYQLADIGLVTPTRDGMNLVAKEYVASRLEDTGVLVLSEFAGAAAEMGEAILINPHDSGSIARALEQALTMSSDEIARRMQALRRRVATNTVHHWVERFIKALRACRNYRPMTSLPSRAGWLQDISRAFNKAPNALLALDYDGTLTELVTVPQEAVPSPELRRLVADICALSGVQVVIISGRDPKTLEQFFEGLPVHLVAEHGFHRRMHGAAGWEEAGLAPDLSWRASVHDILDEYTQRTPGSFIEEKSVSLVWHYRQAEPGFGRWMARELGQHLSETFANSPVAVLYGNKVVEVRPQGFDKGKALLRLIEQQGPFEFVLACGDDRTDEDMFHALPPSAWTIMVGSASPGTHARFHLATPHAVRQFLRRMADGRVKGKPISD